MTRWSWFWIFYAKHLVLVFSKPSPFSTVQRFPTIFHMVTWNGNGAFRLFGCSFRRIFSYAIFCFTTGEHIFVAFYVIQSCFLWILNRYWINDRKNVKFLFYQARSMSLSTAFSLLAQFLTFGSIFKQFSTW